MTGFVFVTVEPGSFWAQFLFSELISYLASSYGEGLCMIKKALGNITSYIRWLRLEVQSWVTHHPSGLNPLMSLCNPSEKGTENITNTSRVVCLRRALDF